MKNGEDVVGQHPKKKGAEGALLGTEMIEGWVGVGVIESLNLFKTNQKNIDAGTPTWVENIFSAFPVWCDMWLVPGGY